MNIVIIGGGFAGIAAARRLRHFKKNLDLTVIDKNKYSEFRPLIPDIISNSIENHYLLYPFSRLARQRGFTFVQGAAVSVNTEAQTVILEKGEEVHYDFLVIATGSNTPVPDQIMKSDIVNTLDALTDAEDISEVLQSGKYHNYVVCGGGYTGIETASHLRKGLRQNHRKGNIIVVEMADVILSTLPEWMRNYVINNCKLLDIHIKTKSRITAVRNGNIILSDGSQISNARLIWSTGLNAALPEIKPNPILGQNNRVKVKNNLRILDNVFAAGDCACCAADNGCYRMAVQSALTSGVCAADNILALLNGKETRSYHFFDLGYLVPMANWHSCGIALGKNIRGNKASFLHYLMSMYRSYGWKNKIMVMVNELRKR